MTNEEILKKAVDKAVKNGWEYHLRGYNYHPDFLLHDPYRWLGFIFSHDFAKAFWGELPTCSDCERPLNEKVPNSNKFCETGYHTISYIPWEHHLQQMVLQENPLSYLAKFLPQGGLEKEGGI